MNSIVLVLVILTAHEFSGLLHAGERRQLLVGEVASESLKEDEIVKLSRKGVVEILSVNGTQIQLLAVRSGILVVSIEDSFGDVRRKIIYDIKKSPRNNLGDMFLGGGKNLVFICRYENNVNCDEKKFLVVGRSRNTDWYYKAKHLCAKHGPCIFNVILEKSSRIALKEKLVSQPYIYRADVFNDGRIHVMLDCKFWTKTRISKLSKSFQWSEYDMSSECGYDSRQYRIKLKASTDRQIEARQIKPWMKTMFHYGVLDVKAEETQTLSHVLSEPEFWLAPHKSAEINHGLEIPVQSSSDDANQYWRRLGFHLDISILKVKEDSLFIAYKITLSEPSSTGGRVYSAGMSSQSWVRLGERETLAYLTTKTENKGEQSHAFFSYIPIIGPFFRNKASNDGSARIRVEIEAVLPGSHTH